MLALIAVFLAAFHSYDRFLAPGERGAVIIIATDRKQARVVLRYIRALLTQVPMLAKLVARETAEAFDLNNRITIEVGTANFRSVRGYTIVAALLDELAFWPDDTSTTPDYEIIAALRPGMATIPNAMLICASSPYARKGALWDAYRAHFGKENDSVLVWKAATRVMNPRINPKIITDAYDRDPASAAAEYGAEFRSDIEGFLTREAVAECIATGIGERPPREGIRYFGFVDPSGGSADSMTLAIGHRENGAAVVDLIRERRPPFSPDDVAREFADTLKRYDISRVIGDKYAGEWPRERFKVHGIAYEPSAKPKSDLYRDLLPLVNSKTIDVVDNERAIQQLIGLERRTSRGGRDIIDHAPSAHDDVANVVAGIASALSASSGYDASLEWVGDISDADYWRMSQINNFILSGGMIG